MTSVQVFNVCTHCKDDGLTVGVPTAVVLSTHPKNTERIATAGGDGNVFIWEFCSDFECGLDQFAKLTYHTQPVNAVAWSSIGDLLASSGDDKMIAIWNKDEKYDYLTEPPAFGENMVFKEKWMPQCKIRGPLAEVSGIEWLHDDKNVAVSSLDGRVSIYSTKKQQQLHTISLNTQFVQGIAVDHTSNLLAVQSQSASAKVYKLIKYKKEKKRNRKYDSCVFATLSYYPMTQKEVEQQKLYNQQYKEEKKEMEDAQNTNNSNAEQKKVAKPKKKRISKSGLFKHNLLSTIRKPHWSPDGLLLAMVAGQSKDKKADCIHVFHRANLSKKLSTFLLPESSAATVVRFHPLKLKVNEEEVEKASIVDRYKMKYRMLFAVICSVELFVFDTSKNHAVLYWKDVDTHGLHDMQWSVDGKSLIIADIEGFITRLCLSDDDILRA
eukprot:CAMPEP_0197021768 /NCGR_PEP_ID=MMETSP1384-20130603/2693_1 /TAXON_ID=29189 /ORGANISM="Ammonia sp." /LENGTH=437 /DNA_ID=CAMNT_0042449675 /DNA_START=1395 /DNA_END=2708 /DNA_ORIENTATION=-